MSTSTTTPESPWPFWRKMTFRFFFNYFLLHMAPWTWLDDVGVGYVTQYYYMANEWVIEAANKYIFHVKDVLVPMGGSGDTSMGWAQLWTYLLLAFVGAAIWSVADLKRQSYEVADYWLRTIVRYYLASVAFSYGIIKLFPLQMPFPNLSQLATPLGDFLPMRLSWMFIGYSAPYQMFAGAAEILAALFLLYRKTVTLGILLAIGAFANVVMINLAYDVPVKIFSIHLLLYSVFLLAYDYKRIANFFLFNKPVHANLLYDITFPKKWMRVSRIVAKSVFILVMIVAQSYGTWEWYQQTKSVEDAKPIKSGVYDVETFIVNNDTIPALVNDTLRWKDMIFEKGGMGSVNSQDTLFRQRYRRGYFYYQPDTLVNEIRFKRWQYDSTSLFTIRYDMADTNSIRLWGTIRNDSVHIALRRSKRHFQLAEKQFHWLSESNR